MRELIYVTDPELGLWKLLTKVSIRNIIIMFTVNCVMVWFYLVKGVCLGRELDEKINI